MTYMTYIIVKLKKINDWRKISKFDLGIIILIILAVLLMVGQWRLSKVVPKKESIMVEGIE